MLTAQMVTPLFVNNAGPWGLLLIAIVVLVLFGRGKIAGLMGEVGKGITAFKKGVKDSTEELEDRREATVDNPDGVRDVTPPATPATPRDRDNA